MNRIILWTLALSFCVIASLSANDNVRAVQAKLKEGGFFFGEVDGAFSSDLSAGITRYQVRNGLQVTGQLDEETSKALGAAPAVTTASPEAAPTSETWRRLRKSDQEFLKRMNSAESRSPQPEPPQVDAAPADDSAASGADAEQADPQPAFRAQSTPRREAAPAQDEESAALTLSPDRLRDYIGAFVLAGLDRQVGAELEFFADRVRYYDEGLVGRDRIRRSLESYNQQWPARRFWIAGDVTMEPQRDGRLRVTFPLRYELQNGGKRSSGKVQKSLLLEVAGEDLQIVAVNEAKAP